MKQKIQLSDHFHYSRLIRFTLPSIGIMIFTSIYSVVDGFFISNYVSKTAFASVNLIIPYTMIISGVGAMLGVGGSALVAKTLGEGDKPGAGKYFTMMMLLTLVTSIFLTVAGIAVLRPVAYLFGATEHMMPDIMTYGSICLMFNLAMHLQYTFQNYLIVAEKPNFALWVVIVAGVSNMILDYLMMAVFKLGVAGAALATGLSQCIGGVIPLVWFISKKNTTAIRFTKTKMELGPVLRACGNGVSEMLSSVSGSITGILYNRQLMLYAGEDGVAAYGVVMYAAFIFIAVFSGYTQGSSPIMGYHYGAQNHAEMKNVLKKSLILLASSAVVLTVSAILLAQPLAKLFVGYDENLMAMTIRAFRICTVPVLFMWFNIYTSGFFTALNDGGVSAAISFMRALVLPVICILVMPHFWQLDGVWYSLVASEALGLFVSLYFIRSKRRKYHY